MIRVNVDVGDAADLIGTFGAGALVRVERSALEAGPFAEIGTLALDGDVDDYAFWDPAGVAGSWYRWRASDAANTAQSAYSAAAHGEDPEDTTSVRYAPLSAALGRYNQDVPDALRTRLDNALRDATQQITELLGFDFFQHQVTDWAPDDVVVRRGRLCVHEGLVSVEAVETRGTAYATWEDLPAAHRVLEAPQKPGHPSFHLRLTGLGIARWPREVRIAAGVRGWPAIPASVAAANVDRARQLVGWDATRPGGASGPEELGAAVGPNRMPDTMYRLRHDYSSWELGLAQCDV